MKGNEVNIPCPCNSGRKYKKCYGKGLQDCAVYLKENKEELLRGHNNREKEVVDFLNGVIGDVKRVFLNDKDNTVVSARLKIVCAFNFAEVFSNCWDLYLNVGANPTPRLEKWIHEFCLIATNRTYSKDETLQKLTTERLLDWRHALIHFMGMGTKSSRPAVVLVSGKATLEEVRTETTFRQLERLGAIALQPFAIWELMKDAALLMLAHMRENINASASDESRKMAHVEGMLRIHSKVMSEGAMEIQLTKQVPPLVAT